MHRSHPRPSRRLATSRRRIEVGQHLSRVGGADDGFRGGIRLYLVERVRREIAEGSYDTPEKLEIALGRMIAAASDD